MGTKWRNVFMGTKIKSNNQVRLKKSDEKCKKPLVYLKEIITYNGGCFECDNCAATNLMSWGFSMICAEGARKGWCYKGKKGNICFASSIHNLIIFLKSYIHSFFFTLYSDFVYIFIIFYKLVSLFFTHSLAYVIMKIKKI